MKLKPRTIILSSILALSLLTQAPAWAAEFGIAHPAQLEAQQQSYFERPDILQIQAQAHPELGWQAWRQAHLEAAAAFLELYPTEHLYFLARDAELLYDAVRLISRDDPQTLARLHLVNVSRANMRHEHLLEYLAQEGITAERLRSDASFQPIFVDTGFSGTIPRVIRERMPEDVRDKLRTHLLVSSNAAMPSLRAFLYPVNPAINGLSPSSMHGTIVSYEHIARATDRSSTFKKIHGEWHPISSATAHTDGQVNSAIARQYQEDLAAHLGTPEAQAALQARRTLWRSLRKNWLTLSQEPWIEFLRTVLTGGDRPKNEPVVRDFLEWVVLIGQKSHPLAPLIGTTSIGLNTESGAQTSNKAQLIAQYPQWAPILENPDTRIPALLDSGQISTLGAILDVINDGEIRQITLKAIHDRLSMPAVYALAQALLEKQEEWVLDLFKHHHSNLHRELFRQAIELATPQILNSIVIGVLSRTHWIGHTDLLRLAIDRSPPERMSTFSTYVFKEGRWSSHPEMVRLALEKASTDSLGAFIQNVFSSSQWQAHSELLRLAIERSPPKLMRDFAYSVFKDGWKLHPELFRLAIDKALPQHLSAFASYANVSFFRENPEYLRLALENEPLELRREYWLFFIETYFRDHPMGGIFRTTNQIENTAMLRAYLRERLGPYPWETEETQAPGECEKQMLGEG